jgi:hypothetical protein
MKPVGTVSVGACPEAPVAVAPAAAPPEKEEEEEAAAGVSGVACRFIAACGA